MSFSGKVKKGNNNQAILLIRTINNVEDLPVVWEVSDKPADYTDGNRHDILNIESNTIFTTIVLT